MPHNKCITHPKPKQKRTLVNVSFNKITKKNNSKVFTFEMGDGNLQNKEVTSEMALFKSPKVRRPYEKKKKSGVLQKRSLNLHFF